MEQLKNKFCFVCFLNHLSQYVYANKWLILKLSSSPMLRKSMSILAILSNLDFKGHIKVKNRKITLFSLL